MSIRPALLPHLAASLLLFGFVAACGEGELVTAEPEQWDDGGDLLLDEDDAYSPEDSVDQALVTPMLDAAELEMLKRINDYRVAKGKAKMRVSIALSRAAEFHSKDMSATGKLSHSSSDGTSFSARVSRYYNCYTRLTENVGYGPSTQAVFEAWKGSSGHNTNMLDGAVKVIGISRVVKDGREWWTTDFGDCVDALLSAGVSSIASNGGFESSDLGTGKWSDVRTLNKWFRGGSGAWSSSRSTSAAYAGSYGMRQKDPSDGHAAVTQLVRAAPGVNYRVQVQARRVSGSTAQVVYLDFLNKDFQRITHKTVGTGTATSWGARKVEATSPSGTRFVRVILYGPGSAGAASTFDFDVAQVKAW